MDFRPGDHKVCVNNRSACDVIGCLGIVVRDAFAKIDGAVVAKFLAEFAGLGVQSEEASIQGGVENALVGLPSPTSTGA